MNILLLRETNPYIGSDASANRFRGLVDGLCRLGHHVTIGVVGGLHKKGEDTNFISPLDNLKMVYLSRANHYNGIVGRLNTYFFDWWHQIILRKKFRRLYKAKYDAVWITSSYTVLALFLIVYKSIKGNSKTFIELNEYNDIYSEDTKGNFLQRRRGIKESRLMLEAIGKIDLFAVMTQTLLNYYKGVAKKDAVFMHLPMTVDMSRFQGVTTNVEYKKPYIAFTGTMTNHKDGVDVLIKAFAKVADKYPAYHLYLAGFWYYDVPMQEKLIAEYGLQDRIHYIGTLTREQIPPFVCNASVLALSRPDSHQSQGGFPTKLGEYLATGNPVCVTKVGEIPNYLIDNESAFMATPGDVDSFADALNRALRDMDNAKRVGENGKKVGEKNFDAYEQSKRLSNFLSSNV